jgi:DNA-binding LytR/AlgR family response regulator
MENKVHILIVEDEFMIAEDISMRLNDFGYEVEGIASSAEKALEILSQGKVDLALLDINIQGQTDGIELAKIIQEKYNIPFIFLSSLANRSIVDRAKDLKPAAYLLKPFNDRQVQISIDLALQNYAENIEATIPSTDETNTKLENKILSINEFIFLKRDSHYTKVQLNDILYLEAEVNYTFIYTNKDKFVYSQNIKKFQEKLPASIFKRVHRSHIVNINNVTGFEGSTIFIGKKAIPVSIANREEIFKHFKAL